MPARVQRIPRAWEPDEEEGIRAELEPGSHRFKPSEELKKTHLVERQGVVEEQVTSDQSDAEFEMAKHVVAVSSSQETSNKNFQYKRKIYQQNYSRITWVYLKRLNTIDLKPL